MRQLALGWLAALSVVAAPVHADVPVTLKGSPASMVRQNEVAKEHGFSFARTPAELRKLEEAGELVRLEGNADYELADFVSFALARPEMRTFIERLAAQYRDGTGEKLVVTSLSRPATRQPGNAHELSVHPTGTAVDLRVSQRAASREWLENTLLSLERQGLLDVTRERHPPHYHVALFASDYMEHVAKLEAREAERRAAEAAAAREALETKVEEAAQLGSALTMTEAPTRREEETLAGWAGLAVLLLGAVAMLHPRLRPGGRQ